MRQKIKILNKLLIFGIVFMLFSCEKDLYENYTANNHHLLVQRKNFEDLKKNPKIIKKLESLATSKKQSLQRHHYDPINNFYIDLDDVMFTQDSLNNQTYTFKIQRSENNNLFENLILKTSKTGGFDAILAQYNQNIIKSTFTTAKEISSSINQNVNFIYLGKKTLSEINSKYYVGDECFEPGYVYVSGDRCASGQHTFSQGTTCDYWATSGMATTGGYVYTMVSIACDGGGGGGDTSGNFSTGPHGIGGGTTSTETPCQQLKSMASKPIANTTPAKTIVDNLNNLVNQMPTNPRERMFVMTPTSIAEDQFVENYVEGPLNGGDVGFDPGTNAISIIMHCHYDTSLLSVFSLSDIQQIYQSLETGNIFNSQTFTTILVTAHGTKYAVKFSPQNDLSPPYNEYFFTGWEFDNIRDKREDKYESFVKQSNTPAQNELGFLKFIKDQNLGIELYKADANFSQWSKLSIGTDGQVKPTPCP